MSKKADRDKVKSYDSLVDTINSMGYNVSSDIETSILAGAKFESEDEDGNKLIGVVMPVRI